MEHKSFFTILASDETIEQSTVFIVLYLRLINNDLLPLGLAAQDLESNRNFSVIVAVLTAFVAPFS